LAEVPHESRPIISVLNTWPDCKHASHREGWCDYTDSKPNLNRQELLKHIFPTKEFSNLSNIFIASFTIGDKEFSEKLCQQANLKRNVTVLLDRDKANQRELQELESCSSKNEIKFLKLGRNGEWPEWFNQHIKLWKFDNLIDGSEMIIFGSGNAAPLSFSLSYENWFKVKAAKESNFSKEHTCLVSALKKAALLDSNGLPIKNVKEQYNKEMVSCRKGAHVMEFEKALAKEKIAPLFSLVNEDNPRQKLVNAINTVEKGREILGTTQIFTDKYLADAMKEAVQRGVKVRLILEDDIIKGSDDKTEAPAFYHKYLKKSGIELRFIETNQNINQFMHMKFLILGGNTLVCGSPQLSYSAFSQSFENLYFITDPGVISDSQKLFQKLWEFAYSDPDA
jgi:HKD family nuclease